MDLGPRKFTFLIGAQSIPSLVATQAERAAEADIVIGIRRPIVQIRREDPIVVIVIPIAAAKNGVVPSSPGLRSLLTLKPP